LPHDLSQPPGPDRLRIVPLGGLGEIGMNCMALEAGPDGDILVVDCGVTFPNRPIGVNVIHADLDWIVARRRRVRGIVVTHGHEDHIGAVPYLLRDVQAPVWGPPYALALIRHRAQEVDVGGDLDLRRVETRAPFRVGAFEVEAIRVTHSIVDATALILRTPAGTVVHSGDFKIEERPLDGEEFDRARLRAVGDKGVALLMSDSTNSFVDGSSGEEQDVADELERQVWESSGRVVVTLFASNVHRLGALARIAERTNKKLLLLGRSLDNHARTAASLGHLPNLTRRLVAPEDAQNVPRDQLLVLATGTQGEAPAAMARLATDKHPVLRLDPGDTVLFSARIIPGNEVSVHDMLNHLARRQIEIRFRGTHPGLHVTGHAHRGEQAELMELVRPRAFLPVHGTLVHLQRHAALARERGIENVVVAENGIVLELSRDDGLRKIDEVGAGRIHRDAGEPVPDAVLDDRGRLAELGVATVVVVVDESGRLLGLPRVSTRGIVDPKTEDDLVRDAARAVADDLRRLGRDLDAHDDETLEATATRAVRRFFGRELRRRPVADAVVVRLG